MAEAEQTELEAIKDSLFNLEQESDPILADIQKHTKNARSAMSRDPVDTLTLSNELVELAILLQRLGDRIAMMGYIVRGAKEYYERTREDHKVRLVQIGEEREVEVDDGKTTRGKKKVKKFITVAAGVADSMKLGLVQAEFEVYSQCEYQMDKLVYTRKAADKTIDSIRSKLSYEKTNESRPQPGR